MWNLKKKKKQDTNELICKPEKSLSLLNVYNQETIQVTLLAIDGHACSSPMYNSNLKSCLLTSLYCIRFLCYCKLVMPIIISKGYVIYHQDMPSSMSCSAHPVFLHIFSLYPAQLCKQKPPFKGPSLILSPFLPQTPADTDLSQFTYLQHYKPRLQTSGPRGLNLGVTLAQLIFATISHQKSSRNQMSTWKFRSGHTGLPLTTCLSHHGGAVTSAAFLEA